MTDAPTAKIRTLMMIDDNQIDQMIYDRIIKRSGLVETVISFSMAENALAHLAANPDDRPDIILLDINMPKMDGFEFLEAAEKAFGADFCVVVVMLTTSLNPRDKERANAFQMVKSYLGKPLTIDSLQEIATLV